MNEYKNALKRLKEFNRVEIQDNSMAKDLAIIEFYLKGFEEYYEILEIIKEKKVDIKYLYYRAELNLEKYNDNYIETLTETEFKKIKEWLER